MTYRLASFPYASRQDFDLETTFDNDLIAPASNEHLARIQMLAWSGFISGSASFTVGAKPATAGMTTPINQSCSFSGEAWTREHLLPTFDELTMASLITNLAGLATNNANSLDGVFRFYKAFTVSSAGSYPVTDDPGELRTLTNFNFHFEIAIGRNNGSTIWPLYFNTTTLGKGLYMLMGISVDCTLQDPSNPDIVGYSTPDWHGAGSVYNPSSGTNIGSVTFSSSDASNPFSVSQTMVGDSSGDGIQAASLTIDCDTLLTPKTTF